jgi:hypothetical protein
MHLGLVQLARAGRQGTTPRDVDLSGPRTREELYRRVHAAWPEPETLPPGTPTSAAIEVDGVELGEMLARGVGRSITAEGLEWLLRRPQAREGGAQPLQSPSHPPVAAASPSPPPGADAPVAAASPSPPRRAHHRSDPGTQRPRRRGGRAARA